MPNYSAEQLKALWIQAGGNPQSAPLAAAVALAESAGNPNAKNVNKSGSEDKGLWQINSIHGALSTFDPLANARAAVSISKNGATWEPWCVTYTDAACGTKGGRYDPFGAGASSARFVGITGAAPGQGGGGPAGDVGGGVAAGIAGAAFGSIADAIMSNIWLTLDVILNNVFYALLVLLGGAAVVVGIIMLAKDSVVGSAINQIKRVV